MALPKFNTQDRILVMLQDKWATQLDPVVDNAVLKGVMLKGIVLTVGDNTINTKLQRPLQGWIVTDMQGAFTQLFRKPSDLPFLTMVLNSSAVSTVDLLVY